jgi:hypothetical protein
VKLDVTIRTGFFRIGVAPSGGHNLVSVTISSSKTVLRKVT